MLIDDENLFETEAVEKGEEIGRIFSHFYYFHTVDGIFSGLPNSPEQIYVEKLFSDDICWNS
jgi:hypothetical protein